MYKDAIFSAGQSAGDMKPAWVELGFKFGDKGAHTSRTIMLAEPSTVLHQRPASATRADYLAARSQAEHQHSELAREEAEIREKPEVEAEEVAEFFRQYGLTDQEYGPVVAGLRTKPRAWRDFMMCFELGLEEPDPKRALQSTVTIAMSYIVGGIIPLAPYIAFHDIKTALYFSVVFTLTGLGVFGFVKGKFTGVSKIKSALQTVLVGGCAAGVAYAPAKLIS